MEGCPNSGTGSDINTHLFFSLGAPEDVVFVSQTLTINSAFDGGGKTYYAAAGFTGAVFEVQSGSLSNCSIVGNGKGYGVQVTGDDVVIEDVNARNCLRGVQVEGSQRVTVSQCTARECVQFGFNAEYSDSVTFEHCDSQLNGLDGFKLRAKATAISVQFCYSAFNGQDPNNAGDGLDIFAGGNGVTIEDSVFEYNLGNGLTFKTDTLNRDDAATYGIPGNVIARRVTCQHNSGWGISAISGFTPDIPLLHGVTILDSVCIDNTEDGLRIDAGDVIVDGLNVDPNGRNGVYIASRAENVSLSNITGVVNDGRV